MKQKIKILIPDKKRQKVTLDNLNSMYSDMKCEFDFSDDTELHVLNKLDTKDDIFCVLINVNGISAPNAREYIYDVITLYKNDEDCTGCDFIFIPTKIEEDKVVKLSNTSREIPLIH